MPFVYSSIPHQLRPNGELDDSWCKNSGRVIKFGKANDVEKRHKKGDEILYELEFACEADALYAEQKILEVLRKDYEPYASKKEHFIVEGISERIAFLELVSKMAMKIKGRLERMVEQEKLEDEAVAQIRAGRVEEGFEDYVEKSVVTYIILASRAPGAMTALCEKWWALVGSDRRWGAAAEHKGP